MVKRYPHTAIVTIEGNPQLVNGKRVASSSRDMVVHGRYDSDGKTIKKNALGEELVIQGNFYTKTAPLPENQPVRIQVDSLGIDRPVVSWEFFQTHSVISI